MTCETCNGTGWVEAGHISSTGGYVLAPCPGCSKESLATHLLPELVRVRALLQRIREWDHLDSAADGPFWKREIDRVLKGHE